jgi:ankyrin repeat protein
MEQRYPALFFAVRDLQSPGNQEPGQPIIEAVVLLLRYGADVNRWDERHQCTPILAAVFNNHIEAVRLLLAHGADPNVCDDEGDSPLRICAQNGYLEMARLLLHCGANKTIHEGGAPTGMNALGFAATRLNIDMVRLLLAHGADPLVGDADDMTTFRRLQITVEIGRIPDDPASQERLREIRQLLGEPPA